MTAGELISLLQQHNPDSELLLRRRFQFRDYYIPYEAINLIELSTRDIIIYEESDGS